MFRSDVDWFAFEAGCIAVAAVYKLRMSHVALCMHRYAQKLKSLRNHCLELDFRKPTADQV